MDERKIIEFKPKEKSADKKGTEEKPSLSDRYFGGADKTPVDKFNLEGMPDNVKGMVQKDLENIKKSAESFDDVYQKKLKEVKDKLQALKDLTDKKRLSLGAHKAILKTLSDGEKWIFGMEQAYDNYYNRLSDENKITFAGQEVRDAMIKSFDKISNSLSVLEEKLSRATNKNI